MSPHFRKREEFTSYLVVDVKSESQEFVGQGIYDTTCKFRYYRTPVLVSINGIQTVCIQQGLSLIVALDTATDQLTPVFIQLVEYTGKVGSKGTACQQDPVLSFQEVNHLIVQYVSEILINLPVKIVPYYRACR